MFWQRSYELIFIIFQIHENGIDVDFQRPVFWPLSALELLICLGGGPLAYYLWLLGR